jgi:hypothetical protein
MCGISPIFSIYKVLWSQGNTYLLVCTILLIRIVSSSEVKIKPDENTSISTRTSVGCKCLAIYSQWLKKQFIFTQDAQSNHARSSSLQIGSDRKRIDLFLKALVALVPVDGCAMLQLHIRQLSLNVSQFHTSGQSMATNMGASGRESMHDYLTLCRIRLKDLQSQRSYSKELTADSHHESMDSERTREEERKLIQILQSFAAYDRVPDVLAEMVRFHAQTK